MTTEKTQWKSVTLTDVVKDIALDLLYDAKKVDYNEFSDNELLESMEIAVDRLKRVLKDLNK